MMRRFSFPVIAAMVCVISFSTAWADDGHHIFRFQSDKVSIASDAGFTEVRYSDLDMTFDPSLPRLPVKIVHMVVPTGKHVTGLAVTVDARVSLPGRYTVFPAQPPTPLSQPDTEFVPPDLSIYTSCNAFPSEPATLSWTGSASGYRIASLKVYPLQYTPCEKRLILNQSITVRFLGPNARKARSNPAWVDEGETPARRILNSLVANPEALSVPFLQPEGRSAAMLPEAIHRYAIVTSAELEPHFRPLAEWKRKKGLSATIVTLEWIETRYPGRDAAEKIREFIKDARDRWGLEWVLLGGDTDQVPHRTAFAMDCEYGSYENNYIPCDLYFSDLDGDWDADGDGVFGETADGVDLYPDVMVGRAPVEDAEETDIFVNKVLAYERTPPDDFTDRMLFLAEVLWWDPYTDSGVGKDVIADRYVPRYFKPITKLYESLGNENEASVVASLNAGSHIINHDGHAGVNIMSVGHGALVSSTMDGLTNAPRHGILYSIGCWPAAFDRDCIAEHFVNSSDGGGVAFIGNSRYGWGSPGNPEYGYSDRFDQQFFKQLFTNGLHRIGEALAAAKAVYVPFSAHENVYRWCQYEITLLGDPEMPIWTGAPKRFSVAHPHEMPADADRVEIRVSDGHAPVAGAGVCLMQGADLYRIATTDAEGEAVFELENADPTSPLLVTVTAPNFIPYEGEIGMAADGPFVRVFVDIPADSGPVLAHPGEVATLDLAFRNTGNETATGVWARITEPGGRVHETAVGDIPPGEVLSVPDAVSVAMPPDLDNGEVFELAVDVAAEGAGHLWQSRIALTAAAPVLVVEGYDVVGRAGHVIAIRAGEAVVIRMTVRNVGLAAAEGASAAVSADSEHLTAGEPMVLVGDLSPGEGRELEMSVFVGEDCPTPSVQKMTVTFDGPGGTSLSESAHVPVGPMGLADDMEGDGGAWVNDGLENGWHLTSVRRHSGRQSWYCGDDEAGTYANNAERILETRPFMIGRDARLSFWCWYEFPNYGTDGFYVEVGDGDDWTVLDFIGSGGALWALTTGNDWLPYEYDLSEFPPGTQLRVRFRFVSDEEEEVVEGVYIDDVRVTPARRKPNLQMIMQILKTMAGEFAVDFSDVDGNGRVGISDAIWILREIAGLR